MSDRFERLARASANDVSRRGILKMIGASAAAATAATVLRPFRGDAQTECQPNFTPCGETCCTPGHACANAAKSRCACKTGLTPCGPNCCPSGLICVNTATGQCGCDPSIRTFCGKGCCPKKDTCSDPATVTCCCPGDTPCGTSCCAAGVACLSKLKGLCGCPKGTTTCGSGATPRCCPAGVPCNSEKCFNATQEQGFGPGYAKPCSVGQCRAGTCSQGCDDSTFCNEGTGCCDCNTPCTDGCNQGTSCNSATGCCVCDTPCVDFECPQGQFCNEGCCIIGG